MKSFLIRKMPKSIVKFFARPYMGGNSIEEAIATVQSLWEEKQIHSTLDLLGENVSTKEEVETNLQIYLELLTSLGPREYITLSIKPTAFGISISTEYCEAILQRLLSAAHAQGIPVTLDMEDSRYTQATLGLYKKFKQQYPNIGTVLQTRLFRTPADIDGLQGPNDRIRLVIGIYDEPAEIAYTNRSYMKELLLEAMKSLLAKGAYVEMATQDIPIIRQSLELISDIGTSSSQVEYQFLLGVPRKKITQQLIANGFIVRLYVPFAVNEAAAIRYLKRRLMNNPRLIRFMLNNIFKRY